MSTDRRYPRTSPVSPSGFDRLRALSYRDQCDHQWRMPGGWQKSAWEPVVANPEWEACRCCGIARPIKRGA